jgi:hypothetical protein
MDFKLSQRRRRSHTFSPATSTASFYMSSKKHHHDYSICAQCVLVMLGCFLSLTFVVVSFFIFHTPHKKLMLTASSSPSLENNNINIHGMKGDRSFALREIKTAGPASAKAQIQSSITAQSRQVLKCKQKIREYERRHDLSARAWSILEQEKENLAAEVDFLRKEALEQTVSWRDMLSARDKRLVYLEDKLARLAGYGNNAKEAAAQVLIRELHDMRRETADFLDRLQRRVDSQQN